MYEPTPIAIIAKNIKGCCVKKVKILFMKLIAIIANPPKIRYQPICFLLVFTSKNNMLNRIFHKLYYVSYQLLGIIRKDSQSGN